MSIEKNYTIDFRFWIYSNNEKLLGKGRIELLQNIKQLGSISNAAKEMKMSYRQAWQMVEEMNNRAKHPLVEKKIGGKKGGGATITYFGEIEIENYLSIHKEIGALLLKMNLD
jgi:molybdate transport system regulatory protein